MSGRRVMTVGHSLMIRLLIPMLTIIPGCSSTYRTFSLPGPCEEGFPRVHGKVYTGPVDQPGDGFSLVIPNGFEPVDAMGIDSEVKRWIDASGSSIGYDYGASINHDYLRSRLAHYSECQDTIGGRRAVVALGQDTAGRMASAEPVDEFMAVATWRDVDDGPHMSVIVTGRDMGSLRRGLAVLRAVRFPKKPPRNLRDTTIRTALPSAAAFAGPAWADEVLAMQHSFRHWYADESV